MCVCRGKKNLRPQNPICQQFCSQQNANDSDKILFAKSELSENDQNNPNIGNLYNWCKARLRRTIETSCMLKIMSPEGNIHINSILMQGSNFFKAIITGSVLYNTENKIQVESTVGVSSNELNLIIYPTENTIDALSVDSLNRYYCVNKSTHQKITRYYLKDESPEIIKSGESEIVCHDKEKYGPVDSPRVPRLGLEFDKLKLFSKNDSGFGDNNGDGKWDINNLIQKTLWEDYGIDRDQNLFDQILIPNIGNSVRRNLGFVLRPFISTENKKTFCPNSVDYKSSTPLLKVLGDYLQRETEPLFWVVTAEGLGGGVADIFPVARSEIEKIWFFYDNGQEVKANPGDEYKKDLYFYWPANLSEPFKKHANQITYTFLPEDRPSDRIKGCIPKN